MSFQLATATILVLCTPLLAADPFVFQDSDRVVLIGSTLIEREQKSGYWELAFTLKNRSKAVTFRNIGWSGDTVQAEARGRFDYADKDKCFNQLVSLAKELKPTVIIICYGQNESFEGKSGVESFIIGMNKLLDAIVPTKARMILMSPTPFEKAQGLPDPSARNADLSLYVDATKRIADRRGIEFVDLFKKWSMQMSRPGQTDSPPITDNGIHLTPEGYRRVAEVLTGQATNSDEESLRVKIVEKNRLFFHRWRPQNETYLFGFRKHEQGKNAAEVVQFDPLIDAAEREIVALKKLVK